MRRRPFFLIFCSLVFLYFPLEFVWRWYTDIALFPGDLFFSIILPAFLLVGLLRVSKIGWYTLIAFGALWGFKDVYELYLSQGENLVPLLTHVLIYGASLTYFINPRIRVIYFDPNLRWWRTKTRYETHTPAVARHKQEWDYPIVLNISEGGCFVRTDQLLNINETLDLAIPLPVPLSDVSVLKAGAEVRWVSDSPSRKGMGLHFKRIVPHQFKALKQYIRKAL